MSNILEASSKVGADDFRHVIRTAVVSRVPKIAFHTYLGASRIPKLGDVALVEVDELGEDDRIEIGCPSWDDAEILGTVPHVQAVVSFTTLTLSKGRRLICAVGGRYATDYLLSEVPTTIETHLDLVTFGGVVGVVSSSNSTKGRVCRVKVLSYFTDTQGQVLNTRRFAPKDVFRFPFDLGDLKLAVVTGGCMEAGKTTTAAALAQVLTEAGKNVYVGKVTGCGSFRDSHRLGKYALGTSEFMAIGYPSTHGISAEETHSLFWSLVSLLSKEAKKAKRRNAWIVIEIADGVAQRETRFILENPEIRLATSLIFYAAPDSVSAAGGVKYLTELGWPMPIISGPVASSEIASHETRALCKAQGLSFFDNQAPRLEPLSHLKAIGRAEDMIESIRESYAIDIATIAGISDQAIVKAFAKVPREDYIGSGPWQTLSSSLKGEYTTTPDADLKHIYQNVLVALDSARHLNNGLPSWLAKAMEHSGVKEGDTVIHLGCGVGYYTAIFAEIVGRGGFVLGIEIDKDLSVRAKKNLSNYPNVDVLHEDGSSTRLIPADVIFVNAGATHVQPTWLDNLKMGGRVLVPLTYARDEAGQLLRVTKEERRLHAEFVQEVFMYPCIGTRNDAYAEALREVVHKRGWHFSGELKFDPENADNSCWLKNDIYWMKRDNDC